MTVWTDARDAMACTEVTVVVRVRRGWRFRLGLWLVASGFRLMGVGTVTVAPEGSG
jgi:hypothetical protein